MNKRNSVVHITVNNKAASIAPVIYGKRWKSESNNHKQSKTLLLYINGLDIFLRTKNENFEKAILYFNQPKDDYTFPLF